MPDTETTNWQEAYDSEDNTMTMPHQDEATEWRDLFKQASSENAQMLHDTNAITDLAVAKLRAYEAEIAQLKEQLANA